MELLYVARTTTTNLIKILLIKQINTNNVKTK